MLLLRSLVDMGEDVSEDGTSFEMFSSNSNLYIMLYGLPYFFRISSEKLYQTVNDLFVFFDILLIGLIEDES